MDNFSIKVQIFWWYSVDLKSSKGQVSASASANLYADFCSSCSCGPGGYWLELQRDRVMAVMELEKEKEAAGVEDAQEGVEDSNGTGKSGWGSGWHGDHDHSKGNMSNCRRSSTERTAMATETSSEWTLICLGSFLTACRPELRSGTPTSGNSVD